jgi:hypothetical protein
MAKANDMRAVKGATANFSATISLDPCNEKAEGEELGRSVVFNKSSIRGVLRW